jgi:hypothetical protein
MSLKSQPVPRSKHTPSQLQTSAGKEPLCSETYTKHINTLTGQNAEFVNVKHGGTYSDLKALVS